MRPVGEARVEHERQMPLPTRITSMHQLIEPLHGPISDLGSCYAVYFEVYTELYQTSVPWLSTFKQLAV
jgi:hypothetical protein